MKMNYKKIILNEARLMKKRILFPVILLLCFTGEAFAEGFTDESLGSGNKAFDVSFWPTSITVPCEKQNIRACNPGDRVSLGCYQYDSEQRSYIKATLLSSIIPRGSRRGMLVDTLWTRYYPYKAEPCRPESDMERKYGCKAKADPESFTEATTKADLECRRVIHQYTSGRYR